MNRVIQKLSMTILVSAITLLSSYTHVLAEDIEIYNRTQTVPNVMFIVDTSSSMSYVVGGKSRMQHVKDALAAVLGDSYDSLNVGIMNLGYWEGSGPDFPVLDINTLVKPIEPSVASPTETVGQFLTRLSGAYQERGDTPTVDTYYEAMRYFRGDTVHRGKFRPGPWVDSRSWYANDQLYPKNAPAYPVPGPSPQDEQYSRKAANPLTYSGGGYDPSIVSAGQSCWTGAFGSGVNPGGTQCNTSNIYQSTPYSSTCNRVDPVPAGNTNSCPGGYTRDCLLWADPSLPSSNPPNECASWGSWYCQGGTVNVPTNAIKGYYQCNHKEYGDFIGNPRYESPISTACTENFIVMLTDGAPSRNNSDDDASSIIYNSSNPSNCMSMPGITNPAILDHGRCGPDIAEFLATQDQSTSQPGIQTVKTYTVGIQLPTGSDTKTYLDMIATKGDGAYYDATDPTTLVSDLKSIVNLITEKPRVISRVATTLDLNNLGTNRPEVYMPMFNYKANEPRWPGNMKGYLANSSGILEGVGTPAQSTFILEMIDTDFDGVDDTEVAAFNPSVESFWSGSADGGDVTQGGVVSILNPSSVTPDSSRNLLTENTSGGLIDLDTTNFDHTDIGLFNLPSLGSNTADNTQVDNLINWVNGVDVFDEDNDPSTTTRNFVGDPLHTDPIILNYNTDGDASTVEKYVAYFMTNEGILHAVDVTSNTSASELFGFLPNDLLDNLDPLQKNVGGTNKIYGLDGPLVYYQDGGIANIDGDKYLFFGMRRGGMNYYALNVTDPSNPSLLWTIKGGVGDFRELGQTWSTPIVTKVKYGASTKVALVFGGGYDSDQDNTVSRVADDQGRAVYVVDALNDSNSDGIADVLWSAGPNSGATNPPNDSHDLNLTIDNAVAGDVSVIDMQGDGIADRLYFADVGGRVWRVDFKGSLDGTAGFGITDDFSGYKLADLADNTVVNNRRFFARPVAAITSSGKMALTLGSGNRAHPLQGVGNVDRVTNRFYTLFDSNPSSVPTSAPSVIDDSVLQDLTGVTTGFTSSTAPGWRIDLNTDEKVFSEAMVLLGEVFFTTYIPPSNSCSNIPDGGNLYAVSIDGKPIRDFDSTVNGLELTKSITTFGIVPGFVPHVDGSGSGNVNVLYGSNVDELFSGSTLIDRFWTNSP